MSRIIDRMNYLEQTLSTIIERLDAFDKLAKRLSVIQEDKKAQSFLKETILEAATEGNFEQIRDSFNNTALIDCVDDKGCNALDLACMNGHVEIVDFLLNHNMNVRQAVTQQGKYEKWTPLHFACLQPNQIIVGLLLRKNTPLLVPNNNGDLPINIAHINHHDEIVKMLTDEQDRKGLYPPALKNPLSDSI